MIIILSPAKTFQETRYKYQQLPFFQNEAEHMNAIMKEKTIGEIEDEMQVSKKIATSVFAYAQTFGHTIQPAIHTYFGAAYKALHAKSLSKDDHRYAEKHVRILSALYGILKPLDGISFYRLHYKEYSEISMIFGVRGYRNTYRKTCRTASSSISHRKNMRAF